MVATFMQQDNRKKIILMGATGSVGEQVFDVVSRYSDRFELSGIAINSNVIKLLELIERYQVKLPRNVAIAQKEVDVEPLKRYYREQREELNLAQGDEALDDLAREVVGDLFIAAIVGSAGLSSTISALHSGKQVALANKEALIMAGNWVMELSRQNGQPVLPIDSEHGALFRLLNSHTHERIHKLWLPASGGAFRDYTMEQMRRATVEDALKHPTWNMGQKITIDSATLVNKGLEVIEAHYLFGVPYEQISVTLHRESLIHALVEYEDGFIYAEMSPTSMTYPISSVLFWPEASPYNDNRLTLDELGRLHLEPVPHEKFPALNLCYEAGRRGGSAPIVLNAANEEAVAAFLHERLTFWGIAEVIEESLNRYEHHELASYEEIFAVNAKARSLSREIAARRSA